jgi:hypothetical protein
MGRVCRKAAPSCRKTALATTSLIMNDGLPLISPIIRIGGIMRKLRPAQIAPLLAITFLFTSCSTENTPSLTESSSTAAVPCPITFQYIGSKFRTIEDHTFRELGWFITNSSSVSVAVTSPVCVKTGNVGTCTEGVDNSIPPGSSDGSVLFTTGNPGSGTVALRANFAGCGTLTAPAFQLTIQ